LSGSKKGVRQGENMILTPRLLGGWKVWKNRNKKV